MTFTLKFIVNIVNNVITIGNIYILIGITKKGNKYALYHSNYIVYSIFRSYGIVKVALILFYQNDNIFKPFFFPKNILKRCET